MKEEPPLEQQSIDSSAEHGPAARPVDLVPAAKTKFPLRSSSLVQRGLALASTLVEPWPGSRLGEIRRLSGHREPISGLAFSRDGRLAFSADKRGTIMMWDIVSGQPVRCLHWDLSLHTYQAISPDWSSDTPVESGDVELVSGCVLKVAFSPDRLTALLTIGDNHSMALSDPGDNLGRVDMATGHRDVVEWGNEYLLEFAEFTPAGQVLVRSRLCRAQHFGRAFLRAVYKLQPKDDDEEPLDEGSFNDLYLVETKTGTILRRYRGIPVALSDVVVSQDGRTALCLEYFRGCHVLDLDTGEWEGILIQPPDWNYYWSAAWLADNCHALFVGGRGGEPRPTTFQRMCLFDTKARRVVCSMVRQGDGYFTSAAVSSDGRLAMLGCEDGTIQLWGLPNPADPGQLASFVAYCALNDDQVPF